MINLEKGGRVDLEKGGLNLTQVKVGLGWRANKFDTGDHFDLDFSLFVLDENGKILNGNENWAIFYNNLTSPDGSIIHSEDDREGSSQEVPIGVPAESATIDLAKLPAEARSVSCIVTIDEATQRKQNFGQVRNSFINIYDATKGDNAPALAGYSLEDEFSTETAVEFGSLVRGSRGWTFKAVGAGYKRGLADFVKEYGMQVKPPSH